MMGWQKVSTEPGAGLCGGCPENKECEHPLPSPGVPALAIHLRWGNGTQPWWVTKGIELPLGSKAVTEVWVQDLEVGHGNARLQSKLLLAVSGWNNRSGQTGGGVWPGSSRETYF